MKVQILPLAYSNAWAKVYSSVYNSVLNSPHSRLYYSLNDSVFKKTKP